MNQFVLNLPCTLHHCNSCPFHSINRERDDLPYCSLFGGPNYGDYEEVMFDKGYRLRICRQTFVCLLKEQPTI